MFSLHRVTLPIISVWLPLLATAANFGPIRTSLRRSLLGLLGKDPDLVVPVT